MLVEKKKIKRGGSIEEKLEKSKIFKSKVLKHKEDIKKYLHL